MRERRIPLLSFLADRLEARSRRKQLVEQAHRIGADFLESQAESYYDSMELSDRIHSAASGELEGYSGEIWRGYFEQRDQLNADHPNLDNEESN